MLFKEFQKFVFQGVSKWFVIIFQSILLLEKVGEGRLNQTFLSFILLNHENLSKPS